MLNTAKKHEDDEQLKLEPIDSKTTKTIKSNESDNAEAENKIISDDGPEVDRFGGPGPLRGISKLLLETRKGQMIFEGRRPDLEKNIAAIIGLRSFANYLRTIWDAASNNDPYADWWLLRVEREIESKETWMNEKIEEYHSVLSQFKNISHEVAHSISPIERELRFSIPYSFRGAMLLMKHDELTKTILTANHVGMVESAKAYFDIEQSAKAARSAFQTVTGYRFTGVTRDDVYAMSPLAQKASELMGPCPTGILDDEVVPKFESSRSLILRGLRLQSKRKKVKSVDVTKVESNPEIK